MTFRDGKRLQKRAPLPSQVHLFKFSKFFYLEFNDIEKQLIKFKTKFSFNKNNRIIPSNQNIYFFYVSPLCSVVRENVNNSEYRTYLTYSTQSRYSTVLLVPLTGETLDVAMVEGTAHSISDKIKVSFRLQRSTCDG